MFLKKRETKPKHSSFDQSTDPIYCQDYTKLKKYQQKDSFVSAGLIKQYITI
jgi:hypothetical protein